ncbi:MAG TPA: acyltransferase family protein [Psychromonas sp.]
MSSEHPQKISSLELGRIIAMFAIVLLHNQVMMKAPLFDQTPWLGYIVNQLARFAVPFFFLLSGYLIQPKLTSAPFKTLSSYSLPLIKIWLVWSIICLVMPFNWELLSTQGYMAERSGYWNWLMQNPFNTVMEGGLVHLWFIPGLICAVAIIASCIRLNITALLPGIAIALYVYGLMGGSYENITEVWTPFFTRNGPFFSTLMVWIGYEIRRRSFTLSFNAAQVLVLLGLSIHSFRGSYLVDGL